MDSVERYLQVFNDLQRRKRWSTGTNFLRFAALTLAASDIDSDDVDLEGTAKLLAAEAGGFSPLASAIRHSVAALLIRRGLDPVPIVHRVKETLALFKRHRLKKGGTPPVLAALLLVLDNGGEVPSETTVARMKSILDRWNQDHFFLTGIDDYPMAAMHATRDLSVEELGVEVEQIYRQLDQAGFSKGEQLQLVSHLLMFSAVGPREAAMRFDRVAAALKRAGQKVRSSHYDEIALLTLSDGDVDAIVLRVLDVRDRLRAAKPRPSAEIAFSLAAGIVLAEEVRKAEDAAEVADVATLRSVQAIIEAQQAAMVAVMAATSTVVVTGSS
ncbi:MAG: DUF4003 family protein [Holophagae bacterium]|jgi:hypothetical protein